MTEVEWLACEDPQRMYDLVAPRRLSERRKQLFAAASFGLLARFLTQPEQIEAIGVLERLADGAATEQDREAACRAAKRCWARGPRDASDGVYVSLMLCRELERWQHSEHALHAVVWLTDGDAERRRCCHMIRDLVGTPDRTAVFSSLWATRNVVVLARTIYDEKAFDRLPILGDALEDAGCDHAEILDHCRQPGEHVRGCWVIDAILCKE